MDYLLKFMIIFHSKIKNIHTTDFIPPHFALPLVNQDLYKVM